MSDLGEKTKGQETLMGPDPSAEEERPKTVRLVRERKRRRKDPEPEPETQRHAVEAPTEPAFVEVRPGAEASPESVPHAALARWDRYEIVRLLGQGGMGAVYEARDKRLDRRVAIKFIHGADPLTTKRFLQEARAQARIDHPNVCKVLEVGEVEGKAYIAMQLIRGRTLIDASASMSVDEKALLLKTVTEAVGVAHGLGIIHRDIKPANIMVEETEGPDGQTRVLRPVLMDFGLAREASATEGLTESGAVMGTPAYMPPEQARGSVRQIDARSDVYSLGATLYDLLCGEPPFSGESAVNILLEVLIKEPVPLRVRDPSIPQALDMIVGKCLNKEPHQRYASAAELAEDLERYLNREQVLARRLGYLTRLYWRGKRNKPMAAAVVALALSLFAFAGYGIRTVIMNAQQEAIAKRRAELGQKLGQAVKELEWLVRSAHLVPLHDTGPEKALVRARMDAIEKEMQGYGDLGAGLDHYALGRGHLALQRWQEARAHLEKAEALGVDDPELHYALGRVLGELYRRALSDARQSGDKSFFAKRKEELDKEFLSPTLSHLERCRGVETIPTSYLDGLIHFYQGRYEDALRDGAGAAEKLPWLYEARVLLGDVSMARALDEKDRGEHERAESDFALAVSHYEQAADIGRSDHQIYEALSEAWVRQEEMDLYRGRDPGPKLEKALAAAEKAIAASPTGSSGQTKKAFAYYFKAQYAEGHGASEQEIERLRRAQIEAGKSAIALHPEDAYGQEITGVGYLRLAERSLSLGKDVEPLLALSYAHLKEAIRIHPSFPWAYNDLGLAYGLSGAGARQRNADAEPVLLQAIEMSRKASVLDEGYLIAFNNTSAFQAELAQWQWDHGREPDALLLEAVQMADRAIAINRSNPLGFANAGLALSLLGASRMERGLDGREAIRRAIASFQSALAIDPQFVFVHRELGRCYRLQAKEERLRSLDPAQSLESGARAVEACLRIEPQNGDCMSVQAEQRAEEAAWLLRSAEGKARGLSLLEEARRLSLKAAQMLPDRADLWLSAGQICLSEANARIAMAQRKEALLIVDEGLVAMAKANERAPGLPRALAIQKALRLRRADLD